MNETTQVIHRTSRLAPRVRDKPLQLHWLDMSFTAEGLEILNSYRHTLRMQTGRTSSLGVALDKLLKEHAALVGSSR